MKAKILYYIDQGPREAPPLVFIHAFPLDHTMWNHQIQALSGKYRVIAYDVRGHGQSDAGDGQYTIELFVDDLMALLDHLQITQTMVCGLSMGGYIALRAMERYPERFSVFILADTRSEADSDEAKIKRSASLKLIKEKGVQAFAEGFLQSALAPETLKTKPDIVDQVRNMILKTPPLGIGGTLLALASRTDTTASLAKIKIPTLILVGEHDSITPPSAARSLSEKIPGARLHILPRAGHLSNLENAEEFNQSLMTILP